jgi:hypothetical protein
MSDHGGMMGNMHGIKMMDECSRMMQSMNEHRMALFSALEIPFPGNGDRRRRSLDEVGRHGEAVCVRTWNGYVITSAKIWALVCHTHRSRCHFPKIMSGRNGGVARTRLACRQWHRPPEFAELLVVEGLDIAITGFAPVEIDQLLSVPPHACSS